MIDIIVVLSLLALFKIGYERGIIAEITDIVALVIATIATFNFIDPFFILLSSLIKIQNQEILKIISGIVIFLSSIFIILAIGYGLELYSYKITILEQINKISGGILALFKTILFWWALFLILSLLPSKGDLKEYVQSTYSYEVISSLNPYIFSVFQYFFPEKINKEIRKVLK